jgi:lysyl-tRNA synthetase class 2
MSDENAPHDPNDSAKEAQLFEVRRAKGEAWKKRGDSPFGNGFKPKHDVSQLEAQYPQPKADIDAIPEADRQASVAGRITAHRDTGKIQWVDVRDRTGKIQLYMNLKATRPEDWELVTQHLDVGDFIGVEGTVMRTNNGQLSIMPKKVVALTKALRALPEKFHGIADVETRYRQRYLDLISTYPQVRDLFKLRTKVIRGIQHFLDARDFIEVETPMLHKPEEAGGATARPFATHHNALDLDLKLRIATELHLKRLVVGGLERVYEIGRIFRNEGIDRRHNPEFTSIEFYQAYATWEDLMVLTEELFETLAKDVLGKAELTYQGQTISLSRPFPRVSMVTSVAEHLKAHGGFDPGDFESMNSKHGTSLKALATYCQLSAQGPERALAVSRAWFGDASHGELEVPQAGGKEVETVGEAIAVLFEHLVEPTLPRDRPAFVVDFPIEISPLARRRDSDGRLTDRFELYMAGMEVANAFSELNDPIDQRQRFEKQMEKKAKGDAEAMPFDRDFIRALEHGMPPTAGEGIGIDRLVMLFSDSPNIREVILFPLLKPVV